MNASPVAAGTPRSLSPMVMIIDSSRRVPDLVTEKELATTSNDVMRQTAQNASTVMEFLKTRFGRDGLDGKGAPLKVVVHAADPYGGPMNNAYWDGNAGMMYLGDGDGTMFKPLGLSKDVIAHEVGHAILESEIQMGFRGEEGALHESFGDVLGVLVDDEDWTIGEDSFTPKIPGDSTRDMANAENYQHVRDAAGKLRNGEPHGLADIPNLAAYRAAQQIGREAMGHVWYQGFTEHLRDNAGFTDAAAATIKAAQQLFGASSTEATAVADAWASVGIISPANAPA